jgi:hypothetical protein
MIKNIVSNSRYVTVQGGTPAQVYINNYSGAMGVGDVRFNPTSQNLQVYDGNTWHDIQSSYPTVGLSAEAESLLDWAREKRAEEYALHEMIKNNEAVRIAYENLNKAKEQLKTTVILAKEYENETTS